MGIDTRHLVCLMMEIMVTQIVVTQDVYFLSGLFETNQLTDKDEIDCV